MIGRETALFVRKSNEKTVVRVETLPLIQTLIESREDTWENSVHTRLNSCNDMVAEEAIYQISCMLRFRHKTSNINRPGRPTDAIMTEISNGFANG